MQEKVYIVLAGVNGAGKSTFYGVHDESGPLFPFCDTEAFQKLPLVNSDKILKEFGDWRDFKDQRKAAETAIRRIRENFKQGISFVQETTLTGKSILRNIDTAKLHGYKVGIIYVGVDNVDIAKERVQYRVNHGGHGIPEEDIEKRYLNSFVNLNTLMEKCDSVLLYDNSTETGFRTVAEYDGEKLMKVSDYSQPPTWVEKYIDVPIVNEIKEQKERSSLDLSSRSSQDHEDLE